MSAPPAANSSLRDCGAMCRASARRRAWISVGSKKRNRSVRRVETLFPTIRKQGSEIWVSFNPLDERDVTWQRFVANPPANAVVQKVGWQDNPYLPQTLDEERKRLLEIDPQAYDHIWEGHCRRLSDAVIFG